MTHAVLKHSVTELENESGVDRKLREQLAARLRTALGNTYRLLLNTQIVHWNAQGPLFFSVHKLTESQYQTLFARIDEIAERIRALGMPAPMSVDSIFVDATVENRKQDGNLATKLRELVRMNDATLVDMRETIELAESSKDVVTADLLTAVAAELEEAAWMFRATMSESPS